MANGFLVVDEKDWKELPPERRDWLIFNTLKSMDGRLSSLEHKPVVDRCFAFVGGIIGGAIAYISIKLGG